MFETINVSKNTAAACWMPTKPERDVKIQGAFSKQRRNQRLAVIVF